MRKINNQENKVIILIGKGEIDKYGKMENTT